MVGILMVPLRSIGGAEIDVDRAPAADHQFVARTERIIAGDRGIQDRRKGRRGIGEEFGTENRQYLAGIISMNFWNSLNGAF
jgi:hypothetical protein